MKNQFRSLTLDPVRPYVSAVPTLKHRWITVTQHRCSFYDNDGKLVKIEVPIGWTLDLATLGPARYIIPKDVIYTLTLPSIFHDQGYANKQRDRLFWDELMNTIMMKQADRTPEFWRKVVYSVVRGPAGYIAWNT